MFLTSLLNMLTIFIVFFIGKISSVTLLGFSDSKLYTIIAILLFLNGFVSFYIKKKYVLYKEVIEYLALIKALVLLFLAIIVAISLVISETSIVFKINEFQIERVIWGQGRLTELMETFINRYFITMPSETKYEIITKAKSPEQLKELIFKYRDEHDKNTLINWLWKWLTGGR